MSLRRTAPLRRTQALMGGGKGLRRARGLDGDSGLARGQRKRRKTVPREIARVVAQRSGGLCVHCCWKMGVGPDQLPSQRARRLHRQGLVRRGVHRHHALPVQSFPGLELAADNLVLLCAECHDEHERAHRRVPLGALPRCCLMLAASTPGGTAYLERTYPPDGGRAGRLPATD